MHRGHPYRNETSRRAPRSDPGYWADTAPRRGYGPEYDAYHPDNPGGKYASTPYGPRRDNDWMGHERPRNMARSDWDRSDDDPRRSPYGSIYGGYGGYDAYGDGRRDDDLRNDRLRRAGAYRPGDDQERSYQPVVPHPSLFDPEYDQWRRDHMNALDNDYHRWRQERYQKFSDDFNTWRQNRPVETGTDTDTGRAGASAAGSSGGSSTSSGSGASKSDSSSS